MMKQPIINPDYQLYPGVTYAATAARVADQILDQYGLPPNGHKVAGPFAFLTLTERCPFIQDAMDKAAPREHGLHHNTALDTTAEAVVAGLSEANGRRLRDVVFYECVLQNDSVMDNIPLDIKVTNVNVTINDKYIRMDQAGWKDALRNYASTMSELIDKDRFIKHDLGNQIALQIYFDLHRKANRIIATGTGKIESKTSGHHSQTLFQANLTIQANSDAAQQVLLATTADA